MHFLTSPLRQLAGRLPAVLWPVLISLTLAVLTYLAVPGGDKLRAGLALFVLIGALWMTQALAPRQIVPGHGRVSDMARAQKDSGDYYRFLIEQVGAAARNMDPMDETLTRLARPPQFMPLQNFDELHRANMNRVFTDFEAKP